MKVYRKIAEDALELGKILGEKIVATDVNERRQIKTSLNAKKSKRSTLESLEVLLHDMEDH